MKQAFFSGICAGLMVGIGGAIYLACAQDGHKYIGALLFSVALLSICMLGFYLFTGKVGYLGEKFTGEQVKCLGIGLVGNYIGATGFGLLISVVCPALYTKSAEICAAKLATPAVYAKALALGAFCGILMYVAVKIFATKGSALGIIFCIPTFILAGFEHSIADMFYMAAHRNFTWQAFLFLLMVVIGNSLGAVILPLLTRAATSRPKQEVSEEKKDEQ